MSPKCNCQHPTPPAPTTQTGIASSLHWRLLKAEAEVRIEASVELQTAPRAPHGAWDVGASYPARCNFELSRLPTSSVGLRTSEPVRLAPTNHLSHNFSPRARPAPVPFLGHQRETASFKIELRLLFLIGGRLCKLFSGGKLRTLAESAHLWDCPYGPSAFCHRDY